MKPGDIVFQEDTVFGRHSFYEIEGVYLGAEGQESVVTLKSLSRRDPDYWSGPKVMAVPEVLIRGKVFAREIEPPPPSQPAEAKR